MHQRHWGPILDARSSKSQPSADPEGFRMVCGAFDERDEGDSRASHARCGGGCVWRICGRDTIRHQEPHGFLRLTAQATGRGKGVLELMGCAKNSHHIVRNLRLLLLRPSQTHLRPTGQNILLHHQLCPDSENRKLQSSMIISTKQKIRKPALRPSTVRIRAWSRDCRRCEGRGRQWTSKSRRRPRGMMR